MNVDRIIYQDWIVELGRDPSLTWEESYRSPKNYNLELVKAVNQAINGLQPDEALFIRQFYMQGMGYREIAAWTGRTIRRLETIHKVALKKLKCQLYEMMRKKYNLTYQADTDCPLCNNPHIEAINSLVASKDDQETWSRILGTLGERFGIKNLSPSRIKGHIKYHIR
jgi:hypothetical protein